VQNKVLEALAMGKRVMASAAVCETFGGDLPEGLVRCETTADYAQYIAAPANGCIRRRASVQFRWERSLETISLELSKICGGPKRESENTYSAAIVDATRAQKVGAVHP
jgi:hypothetical protein